MAVIISNGNTTLGTASGFYRVESYNMAMFSTTDLALSSARTIAVTFANAGNCQGIVLCFTTPTAESVAMKDILVELQENVASVWTTRTSQTVTELNITAASVAGTANENVSEGGWIMPVQFSTPYAVDTTASKWRFQITESGAQSGIWSIRTSNTTAPFYATWCDNAVTASSGNDCIICKDVVTVDMNFTMKGVLGTGDSNNSVAGVICRSTTPTPANVANLVWGTGGSYTLTLDGYLVLGAHSGFRAGTLASPITLANKGKINIIAATSGTNNCSGFVSPECRNASSARKMSFFAYGEIPSITSAVLASDAASGQPVIVTTSPTGWNAGDTVFVGGQDIKNSGDRTVHTILTVVGTTITLTGNLATNNRKAGGHVIRLNGYGFEIAAPGTINSFSNVLPMPSNFTISGCRVQFTGFNCTPNGGSATICGDNVNNMSPQTVRYCSAETNTTATTPGGLFSGYQSDSGPSYYDHCNSCNYLFYGTLMSAQVDSRVDKRIYVTNCISLTPRASQNISTNIGNVITMTDNVFENNNTSLISLQGANCVITGNRFYGAAGTITTGAFIINGLVNSVIGNNTYDNCDCATSVRQGLTSTYDTGSVFGASQANTIDVAAGYSTNLISFQYVMRSPVGNLTIDNSVVTNTLPGSFLKITNFNSTANDDRVYSTYGLFQKCGTGLADTTARTAGGYSLRMSPNSSSLALAWPILPAERIIPTGNIQNKTMTISAWVYINNAAYYAGTNTLPTLNVTYDGSTTATSAASASAGSWQRLSVTFTPTTTTGSISMWISGATDATGANTYFYIDDVAVAYPPGTTVNLGGLDLGFDALPVWPPISTMPIPGSDWDELTANHATAGSFGELASRTEVKVDDTTALIISK